MQKIESKTECAISSDIQDSDSDKSDRSIIDQIISDRYEILEYVIRDSIDDMINKVVFQLNRNVTNNEQTNEEIFTVNSELTSPMTVLNFDSRVESGQSTKNQEVITSEENTSCSQFSTSLLTWANLLGKESSDEKLHQSLEETNRLLETIVPSPTIGIKDDKTTMTLPNQTQSSSTIDNTIQQTIITPQVINK